MMRNSKNSMKMRPYLSYEIISLSFLSSGHHTA